MIPIGVLGPAGVLQPMHAVCYGIKHQREGGLSGRTGHSGAIRQQPLDGAWAQV